VSSAEKNRSGIDSHGFATLAPTQISVLLYPPGTARDRSVVERDAQVTPVR
jgi:hypothetical protein